MEFRLQTFSWKQSSHHTSAIQPLCCRAMNNKTSAKSYKSYNNSKTYGYNSGLCNTYVNVWSDMNTMHFIYRSARRNEKYPTSSEVKEQSFACTLPSGTTEESQQGNSNLKCHVRHPFELCRHAPNQQRAEKLKEVEIIRKKNLWMSYKAVSSSFVRLAFCTQIAHL